MHPQTAYYLANHSKYKYVPNAKTTANKAVQALLNDGYIFLFSDYDKESRTWTSHLVKPLEGKHRILQG